MATVNIEKHGDFYRAWHTDAREIYAALGDVVMQKLGGADTIGIPAHNLESAVCELNRKGFNVKINTRMWDIPSTAFQAT